MKIAGFIIIAFGLIDLGGSYADFDLWGGFLGLELPEMLWKFSSYIEIAIGYGLIQLGSKKSDSEPEAEAE
jgi:hypothetical protein